MKLEELNQIVSDDATPMDALREAGRALEPVVGRKVRAASKAELSSEILQALEDASEASQYQVALNAIAPVFGLATIETLDEVEAKAELAGDTEDDDAPEGEGEDAEDDDEDDDAPEGVEKLVWIRSNPLRLPAYLNDVVINPTGAIMALAHTVVTPSRAREVIGTIGRLNRHPAVSQSPELNLEDIR